MNTDELLQDAAQRAIRYLQGIDSRAVAPHETALEDLVKFRETLPMHGHSAMSTLRLLDEVGSPAAVASAGRRYYGFVTGGALPVAVASNWLATAWDQNAALWVTGPAAAALEQVTLTWIIEMLGLPAGTGGAFVTGASMANFTALAAARGAVLGKAGWNFKEQGAYGAPKLRVLVGEEGHSTLIKALWLLGFGTATLERVPVDGQGRMRAEKLPPLDERCIVCIQAGNVNSGAFDPAAQICAAAHAAGAWVHVDGAFGLWAGASKQFEPLVHGVAAADSWSTDAHKWLNTPYDCGIALVRAPERLKEAMSISAAYLPQDERREPCHFTPELSRRARAVDVWAALRTLGRAGVADLIERTCWLAARIAQQLQQGGRTAGLTVLNEVVLNQVLVAAADDAATDRLVAAVQRDGTCWCGGSFWQGRRVMRISVSGWATTADDIDKSARAILRCASA